MRFLFMTFEGGGYVPAPLLAAAAQRDAEICRGGHGTILRPLAHGVPLVVMPMGRGHADNAVRVEWLGARVWISERASRSRIKSVLVQVLTNFTFRKDVHRSSMRRSDSEANPSRAAEWIASLARSDPALAA
jgi:UDP:flavonoid glycosyltransferase YjiC (YdhE family)